MKELKMSTFLCFPGNELVEVINKQETTDSKPFLECPLCPHPVFPTDSTYVCMCLCTDI